MFKLMVFAGFLVFLVLGLLWVVREKRRYLSGRDRMRDGLIGSDLPEAASYRDDSAHDSSAGHGDSGDAGF